MLDWIKRRKLAECQHSHFPASWLWINTTHLPHSPITMSYTFKHWTLIKPPFSSMLVQEFCYFLSWLLPHGTFPRWAQCTSWGASRCLQTEHTGEVWLQTWWWVVLPASSAPFWGSSFSSKMRNWRFSSLPHKMMHTEVSCKHNYASFFQNFQKNWLPWLNLVTCQSISTVCVFLVCIFVCLHGYKFAHLVFMHVCAQLCEGQRLTSPFSLDTFHLISLRQSLSLSELGVH